MLYFYKLYNVYEKSKMNHSFEWKVPSNLFACEVDNALYGNLHNEALSGARTGASNA